MLEMEDLTKIQKWLDDCDKEVSGEIFTTTKTYVDLIYQGNDPKTLSLKFIEQLNNVRLGEVTLPQMRQETHKAIGRIRMAA